ncbi:pilus assembly protein N-terminal domain-containing protein [Billgrantia tianxiuensis]|uniref:pilus assembly protein N-terminal domain-containing protein n=1 Tax=Billgrantia tianxiuensis TaxID=2497861 RepID=UPI001916082A|nr:pilus assembly protein N-terminal domain-containing protein [Halomonas tianxiuensis]
MSMQEQGYERGEYRGTAHKGMAHKGTAWQSDTWKGWVLAGVMALALGWASGGQAQESTRSIAMPVEGRAVSVAVELNKAQVLQFPRAVRVVSVGNPDIADLVVMGSRQLYVLGKSTGTTNVVLWDQSENVQGTLNVTVTHDLEALKSHLHVLLPDENIQVRSAQDSIVLSGEVSSAERLDTALRLATRFAGGGENAVLNLMQVGGANQVMLDVKVAEVSRSLVKRLEANFDVFNVGSSAFRAGAVTGERPSPMQYSRGLEVAAGCLSSTMVLPSAQSSESSRPPHPVSRTPASSPATSAATTYSIWCWTWPAARGWPRSSPSPTSPP